MSDQQDTQTVKTNSAPWEPQQSYLKKGLERAESLYNSPGPQYFPGSTVAGFSPTQTQAQNLGEYLAHERRVLVPRAEAAQFLADVDALRESTDRLAARVALLEATRNGPRENP